MKPTIPVIITRPTQEAEEFACKLAGEGYAAIIEPSLGIRYNKQPLAVESAQADYIVVTSPRTVQAMLSHSINTSKTLYVVGNATADKLREAGYTNIAMARKNVSELLHELVASHPRNQPLLYMRGQDVHTDLTGELKSKGFQITEFICYEAILSEQFSDEVLDIFKNQKPAVLTFFSARTAAHFCKLLEQYAVRDCRSVAVVCISPAVQAACSHISWKSLSHAAEPDAQSMIAATTRALQQMNAAAPHIPQPAKKASPTLPLLMLLLAGGAALMFFLQEVDTPEPDSETYVAEGPAVNLPPETPAPPIINLQDALDAKALVEEQRALLDKLNERLNAQSSPFSPEALQQFNQERDAARLEAAMWKCLALLERELTEEALLYCQTVATHSEVLELLKELETVAGTSIEPYNSLVQEFDALIPAALLLAKERADASANWLERVRSNLRSLVTLRRTGNIEGTSADVVIARAEYQLTQKNLEQAVVEIEGLPPAEKAVFTPWLAKAKAVYTYDKAMKKLRFILTSMHG